MSQFKMKGKSNQSFLPLDNPISTDHWQETQSHFIKIQQDSATVGELTIDYATPLPLLGEGM